MSSTSKPRANDNEILLLISIRRQTAFESMRQIVEGFGSPPHMIPSIAPLNNYLMNMVFCVELMLKLLSRDWKSHEVGSMYETVFKRPHRATDLMRDIKSAIVDQKYLYEPASGLEASVPELEALYDELSSKLKESFPVFSIDRTVSLPKSFMEYVCDHAERFCRTQSETFGPHNAPPANFRETLFLKCQRQVEQVRQAFRDQAASRDSFDFTTRIESLT